MLDKSPRDHRVFEQLVECAPDAAVVVDARGTIVLVNRQAELMFGYPREELIGASVELLVPDALRGRHVGLRSTFAQMPTTRPMGSGRELSARHKNGGEVAVEISLSPIETDTGKWTQALIRDVSRRRLLESIARASQERLVSAVESVQAPFALFDDQDELMLCNGAWTAFFQPGAEAAGPSSYRGLMERAVVTGLLVTQAETAPQFVLRWWSYHGDPQGAFELRSITGQTHRLTERRTPDGGTVVTIWDVTAEVRREEELLKARQLAEAANLAKSEFLASMSHELRTPLNAILGFAELVRRDKKHPLSERQNERLDHVLRGGRHLLRLIEDVLDLARIEAGRVSVALQPIAAASALQEAMETVSSLADDRQVNLTIAASEVGEVRADPTRLVQVLTNFASNAVKYGSPQGNVILYVEPRGTWVRCGVRDDGHGIADDKRAQMFQPFQRAGQETGPIEGTGIGLSICKQLAELMAGSVGFHSEVGVGSDFWIDLPLA
jgi:PAS domain S-box-containing protein